MEAKDCRKDWSIVTGYRLSGVQYLEGDYCETHFHSFRRLVAIFSSIGLLAVNFLLLFKCVHGVLLFGNFCIIL